MAQASLTKRTVDAAKPATKDHFLWDDEVAGFGLKVTPKGARIYVFQYRIARPGEAERTPARRYTIGKHGSPWTPEQARKRAKELAGYVERGIDPRQQELDEIATADEAARNESERNRLEGELAFNKFAALWLEHYEDEKGRRPSSVRLARLVVDRYLTPALGQKPMPHIGRDQLQPIIDSSELRLRKGMRRAVFAYASVLFGWAAKRGDIASNPLAEMVKPMALKSRDRVLTDEELAEVWRGTQTIGEPFGPFFRLLILTGQRRSEVAAMSWAELDRSSTTWTIPVDRAKNGVAHIVPLNRQVVDELDRLAKVVSDDTEERVWPKTGFVLTTTGKTPISGMTKAKAAIDAAIYKARRGDREHGQHQDDEHAEPMAPWRIHDLRRTLATGFQRLGIRFEVTEATLNHVSGAKGGIAGIYQRHDWKEEKRSALDAWARHVEALVGGHDGSNVVALNRATHPAVA